MKYKSKIMYTDAAQTPDNHISVGTGNILIPLELLTRMADLLSYWDLSNYDYTIQCDYDDVMSAITKKLQAIEIRKAYTKLVCAKDEDSRFYARIEYLKLRNKTHE